MATRLTQFLEEISRIQGLLQVWNSQTAKGWFALKKDEVLDTKRIVLTPLDHDYICNGHLTAIERIVSKNSNLSWHTYHIDCTTINVQTIGGHMIQAHVPEIVLNFYMHDNEE